MKDVSNIKCKKSTKVLSHRNQTRNEKHKVTNCYSKDEHEQKNETSVKAVKKEKKYHTSFGMHTYIMTHGAYVMTYQAKDVMWYQLSLYANETIQTFSVIIIVYHKYSCSLLVALCKLNDAVQDTLHRRTYVSVVI